MADKKISALTAATTPLAGSEVLPIVQGGATVKVSVDNLTVGKNVEMNRLTANAVSGTSGIFKTSAATGSNFVTFNDTAIKFYLGYTSGGTENFDLVNMENGSMGLGNNGAYGLRIETTNDVTAVSGNLVIGTANKGIDFSANTHAAGMTSELLNDYEEGTFIPTLSGATTTTYTTQTGRYTKIGRQIFFHCELEINSVGNGSTTIVLLGDLPTALGSPYSTISVGFFNGIATAVSSLTGYIGAAGGNSVQFQSLVVAATNTAPNAVFANGARVMFSGQYSV